MEYLVEKNRMTNIIQIWKEKKRQMSERVKETLCTSCEHREVCVHKLDYLNILKAIENARVSVVKETQDGGFSSKKVADYDFISGISVGCRYYRNWTDTYHDGDSQCLIF